MSCICYSTPIGYGYGYGTISYIGCTLATPNTLTSQNKSKLDSGQLQPSSLFPFPKLVSHVFFLVWVSLVLSAIWRSYSIPF